MTYKILEKVSQFLSEIFQTFIFCPKLDQIMDTLDVALLAAMEENARISLKNLAKDLDVKTSTIYHRLNKLRKQGMLERFTIVVNPSRLGLHEQQLVTLRLKKMFIGKLDVMFVESFAKYLVEQYPEIQYCAIGEDAQIFLMGIFRNATDAEKFRRELELNPYLDSIHTIKMQKVYKGDKSVTFSPSFFNNTNILDELAENAAIDADLPENEDEIPNGIDELDED
jgi:DNA-binding Lrp family transcriptional regulator